MREFTPGTLSDLVSHVIGGGTPSRGNVEYWQGDIPWASVKDISDSPRFLMSTEEYISAKGLRLSAANLIPVGVLLIATRMAVGATTLTVEKTAINQDLKALFPKASIDVEFLRYLLLASHEHFNKHSIGSTVKGISVKALMETPVLYPTDKKEQRSIAEVLSAVDEQIEQAEALVEKQASIFTGFLQDLFPEGFAVDLKPKNTMADALVRIESGKSFMCSDKPAEQGCWGVLKVSAVRPDGFDSAENKAVENRKLVQEQYEVKHGDLLMTRANTAELVGAACLVDTPPAKLLLCDKTLRLCPKSGVNPAYLWLWLRTPIARKHIDAHATGTSAGMKNIGQSAIRSLPLHLPDLSVQTSRAEPVVAQLDFLCLLNEEIAKLRFQKEGLMRDLLTGATRIQ